MQIPADHLPTPPVSPSWLTTGILYQIQLRCFSPEGTIRAAQVRLPKLAELGITTVYLCPCFVADDDPDVRFWSPRQKQSGMNNPRNPYRIKDFYHIDPEYGTVQDLKDFVKVAHTLNLRVLLDLVYLHCGPRAVFLDEHPDFIHRDEFGKPASSDWAFPCLNLDNPHLRDYLWSNMEWCIRTFDVDGFRCDVSDGIPLDFWEVGRIRIEKIKSDIGMLAEGLRPNDQLKAFDLNYGWWGGEWDQVTEMKKSWEKLQKERPPGCAKFIRFIDNHDFANDAYDNRLEMRWGSAKVEAALVGIFTVDGVPFLYNGQEIADTSRHSLFGKTPINESQFTTPIGMARFAFCQQLCRLRKSEVALQRGALTWIDIEANPNVLAFERIDGSDRILVLINLSNQSSNVVLPEIEGPFVPLFSRAEMGDPLRGMTLGAFGFFIGKLDTRKVAPSAIDPSAEGVTRP